VTGWVLLQWPSGWVTPFYGNHPPGAASWLGQLPDWVIPSTCPINHLAGGHQHWATPRCVGHRSFGVVGHQSMAGVYLPPMVTPQDDHLTSFSVSTSFFDICLLVLTQTVIISYIFALSSRLVSGLFVLIVGYLSLKSLLQIKMGVNKCPFIHLLSCIQSHIVFQLLEPASSQISFHHCKARVHQQHS
jgi:hypothetical protein